MLGMMDRRCVIGRLHQQQKCAVIGRGGSITHYEMVEMKSVSQWIIGPSAAVLTAVGNRSEEMYREDRNFTLAQVSTTVSSQAGVDILRVTHY